MPEVTLIPDAQVLAVSIEECGQPLVDPRVDPWLRVDDRKRDPAGVWLHVRAGVAG